MTDKIISKSKYDVVHASDLYTEADQYNADLKSINDLIKTTEKAYRIAQDINFKNPTPSNYNTESDAYFDFENANEIKAGFLSKGSPTNN